MIENFAEFSMDMMNTILRYGGAGEEIIEDAEKTMIMPQEDDCYPSAVGSKAAGGGGAGKSGEAEARQATKNYIFQHDKDGKDLSRAGAVQYEHALKSYFENERHYKKNRGDLSWYLLDCLSPQLAIKVRSQPEFEAARRQKNSFKIWQLIKFCCTEEGGHSIMLDIIGCSDSSTTRTLQRTLQSTERSPQEY